MTNKKREKILNRAAYHFYADHKLEPAADELINQIKQDWEDTPPKNTEYARLINGLLLAFVTLVGIEHFIGLGEYEALLQVCNVIGPVLISIIVAMIALCVLIYEPIARQVKISSEYDLSNWAKYRNWREGATSHRLEYFIRSSWYLIISLFILPISGYFITTLLVIVGWILMEIFKSKSYNTMNKLLRYEAERLQKVF